MMTIQFQCIEQFGQFECSTLKMEYIDESDDDYTMHSDENHIFCNVIKLWKSLKEFLERIS